MYLLSSRGPGVRVANNPMGSLASKDVEVTLVCGCSKIPANVMGILPGWILNVSFSFEQDKVNKIQPYIKVTACAKMNLFFILFALLDFNSVKGI